MSGTVSFDVFDTVVTRTFAHPRDVFVRLGQALRQRGSQFDAFAFARARWTAELTARKRSPHTEVMLADIYRTLAADLGWDEETAQAAQALELEIEARHLRGVPLMRPRLAAARAQAGRLVFLSDMYLPSAVLRPWLEREGVALPQDLLFISGETHTNKSSGHMFATARDATDGDFTRWQHAGDHAFADVEKPRQLGIASIHLTHAQLTVREQAARGTDGEFAAPWRSLLAGAMRLARLEHTPTTERDAVLWEIGATVGGPLFHGFVRWVLDEAKERGIRRLYFVARDGQIFWRIAQAIQAAESNGVECRYLYASRLVFAGPLELGAPDALRELVAPTGHFHSLRQALAHLGLDETWARSRLPTRFQSIAVGANLPQAEREALADWLLAPEHAGALQAAVDQRAAQARAYLESEGLRAGEPVALVDTGWRGTIQKNLERILPAEGPPVPLTGFYLGLMPPRPPVATGTMHGYTNQFGPLPVLRDESHKVLIELMAQSDHGQVAGFTQRDGQWAPQLRDAGPVNLAEIRMFQEAILAFTHRLLESTTEAATPSEEFARTVIGLYRKFHDRPSEREARVFGFLPHADQVFEQGYASLCADLKLPAVLSALADHRKRPPHWWIQGQATLGNALPLRAFAWLKAWRWRLAGRHP